jgi:hypothetical protein
MRGETQLLRAGEHLVRRACRRLPPDLRDARFREWTAELPAILHDPAVKTALARAASMLAYAADQGRGTAPGPLRRAVTSRFVREAFLTATLMTATGNLLLITQAGRPVLSHLMLLASWLLSFATLIFGELIMQSLRWPLRFRRYRKGRRA